MRILYDNEVFDSTITASSEASFFDFDTALNDTRLSRVGRTTGDTSENIVFDMAAAVDVSYVSILSHNLTDAATVTLEGNATDSWGSPSFTTSLTVSDEIIKTFAEQSYRYWRLVFVDAANPDGYIQLAYVFLGVYLTMPGMNLGQIIPKKSNSEAQKSISGQLYGDRRLNFKAAEIVFQSITQTEKTNIDTFFAVVDVVRPFILLIWEDDLDVEPPIYCALTVQLEWSRMQNEGLLWQLTLNFEEAK